MGITETTKNSQTPFLVAGTYGQSIPSHVWQNYAKVAVAGVVAIFPCEEVGLRQRRNPGVTHPGERLFRYFACTFAYTENACSRPSPIIAGAHDGARYVWHDVSRQKP